MRGGRTRIAAGSRSLSPRSDPEPEHRLGRWLLALARNQSRGVFALNLAPQFTLWSGRIVAEYRRREQVQ